MATQKIVLAYSGGLDTSYCIPYLIEKGYEIYAININTGGFDLQEIERIKSRAIQLGAIHFESLDITNTYYEKCIKYLIFGNILRNNTYPLSVSSERPFQALALLEYCQKNGIQKIAHGSTGAGNDQIRFDYIFKSLAPEIEIITPIREQSLSRQEELAYLSSKGFNWPDVQKDYSINQGIWGTSIGGKETLTSNESLPEKAYLKQLKKEEGEVIKLTFTKGEITALNGEKSTPINLITKLEKLASQYAIGRDVHVGDTIIGIKGRVGFEAASPLIIIKAHELLEKHVLTKWQIHWKKQLADWYGMMLHEAQYLDPLMRNIENLMTDMQQNVNGIVKVKLSPYRFELIGIESENDLMASKFGSYGESNTGWTGQDAIGFTNIISNATRIYYSVNKNETI